MPTEPVAQPGEESSEPTRWRLGRMDLSKIAGGPVYRHGAGSGLHQSDPVGPRGSFGAAAHSELGHEVRDVDSGGALADIQGLTDLAVGEARGDHFKHFALARSQFRADRRVGVHGVITFCSGSSQLRSLALKADRANTETLYSLARRLTTTLYFSGRRGSAMLPGCRRLVLCGR